MQDLIPKCCYSSSGLCSTAGK